MRKSVIENRPLILSLFFCFWAGNQINASGQVDSTLTLAYCQNEAISNYPSAKDKDLLKKASELRLQSIQTNLLPQMDLSGQATYQSDAIDIAIPIPGHPVAINQSKDQYKAVLDINQVIFDGRATHFQKLVEESNTEASVQQVDVDLFKVREQVNNIYFRLLSLQENKKLLNNALNEINEREKVMASSIQNGVLMPSDIDPLEAERLNTEQQLAEIDISRKTSLTILSILLNKTVGDSANFHLPVVEIPDSVKTDRPEYKLFDLQTQQIENNKLLLKTQLFPKIAAFGQAGYGRPGLNMLDDNFEPFYIVGITFKWNFFDWEKNNHDRQALDVEKDMITTRHENFDKNLNIDLQNKLSVIHKLDDALQRDSMIVELRSRIQHSSASRLENGVITPTDYLTDLNAETNAKINYQTHKIQLVEAKTDYLLTKGIY